MIVDFQRALFWPNICLFYAVLGMMANISFCLHFHEAIFLIFRAYDSIFQAWRHADARLTLLFIH